FKASELNSLPEGQRDSRVGYIADAQTFERVWEAFTPNAENPKGVPKIDFKKDIVLFLRNTQFLNSFSSVKVHLNDGKASIAAISTRTAQKINDRLNMVVLVIPRKQVRELELDANKTVKIPPP